MQAIALKVGELSKRTGLTVRTLHYYDEIGLLSPSHYTEAGHRLYTVDDITRLQQVVSLRQLGFSLEEIGSCLNRPDFTLSDVLQMHIVRLKEQIEQQYRLCTRLEMLAVSLRSTEKLSIDEFLQTIEVITMFEKYYTPEQLEELRQRKETVGEERIRQVEQEWPVLIGLVRAEMENGTDPTSEKVQLLAKRWMGLVNEFTGGNPEIAKVVNKMYQEEPEVRNQANFDPILMEYVSKMLVVAKQAT